jgi:hypothetical protein
LERFSSRAYLIADIDRLAVFRKLLELQDFAFEVCDRLFEIEIIEHSRCCIQGCSAVKKPPKGSFAAKKARLT